MLDNNRRCRAATRRNRLYCDAHLQLRVRRLKMAKARRRVRLGLRLPPLIDMQAVEIAKARVRLAQAGGYMSRRTAALMLYGLRLAASNIRFLDEYQNATESSGTVLANSNDIYCLPVTHSKSCLYTTNTS
jgi:hypothetical protein